MYHDSGFLCCYRSRLLTQFTSNHIRALFAERHRNPHRRTQTTQQALSRHREILPKSSAALADPVSASRSIAEYTRGTIVPQNRPQVRIPWIQNAAKARLVHVVTMVPINSSRQSRFPVRFFSLSSSVPRAFTTHLLPSLG